MTPPTIAPNRHRVLLVGGTDAKAADRRGDLSGFGYDAAGPVRTTAEWDAVDDLRSFDVILVDAARDGGLSAELSDPGRYHDWPVVVIADDTPVHDLGGKDRSGGPARPTGGAAGAAAATPDAGFDHWINGTSVFGYLHEPVSADLLRETVDLARRRHDECVHLQRKSEHLASAAAVLEKALADRKLVERAKSILIRRLGLTEDAAHRRLQSESQNRREPLADVAQRVIESDKMLSAG